MGVLVLNLAFQRHEGGKAAARGVLAGDRGKAGDGAVVAAGVEGDVLRQQRGGDDPSSHEEHTFTAVLRVEYLVSFDCFLQLPSVGE